MDNFYEQLISEGITLHYKILKVFNYIFLIVAIISLLLIEPILSAYFIILAFLSYLLRINSLVEYEYSFTNGEIDIDKIIEMKRRKNVINLDVKDIEILAREDSNELKYIKMPKKTINCTLRKNKNSLYKAVVNSRNQRFVLIFSPDEEFIKLCKRYNPRAVKL